MSMNRSDFEQLRVGDFLVRNDGERNALELLIMDRDEESVTVDWPHEGRVQLWWYEGPDNYGFIDDEDGLVEGLHAEEAGFRKARKAS